VSGRDGRKAIVLGLLARLAALWFVLQALVVKEDLLADGPDKLFTAIYAFESAILEVRGLVWSGCEHLAI